MRASRLGASAAAMRQPEASRKATSALSRRLPRGSARATSARPRCGQGAGHPKHRISIHKAAHGFGSEFVAPSGPGGEGSGT